MERRCKQELLGPIFIQVNIWRFFEERSLVKQFPRLHPVNGNPCRHRLQLIAAFIALFEPRLSTECAEIDFI
jgi:hypothetical protein